MCEVGSLEEGQAYEFQVLAVNDHGQSEPLTTSKSMIAKHQFGKFVGDICMSVCMTSMSECMVICVWLACAWI